MTVSGCSGGGKTTLLHELDKRGYATVPEPGRRIVIDQQEIGGDVLPWKNPKSFVEHALEMALIDLQNRPTADDWVFFDRGLVDAASALSTFTGVAISDYLEGKPRYHRTAFLTPPWPEIYETDNERKHGLSEAIKEYERLLVTYPAVGYDVVILEKTSVHDRANAILERLDEDSKSTV